MRPVVRYESWVLQDFLSAPQNPPADVLGGLEPDPNSLRRLLPCEGSHAFCDECLRQHLGSVFVQLFWPGLAQTLRARSTQIWGT